MKLHLLQLDEPELNIRERGKAERRNDGIKAFKSIYMQTETVLKSFKYI